MAMEYGYFFFSSEQANLQREMEEKVGRKYVVGTIIYKGKKRNFTELCSTNSSRYSDAVLVAEGKPSGFKYTKPHGTVTKSVARGG